MGVKLQFEVSTAGHLIECAECGVGLASRPGWRLEHQADGSHLAVFWGRPSATPAYGSTRAPLPETKGGS